MPFLLYNTSEIIVTVCETSNSVTYFISWSLKSSSRLTSPASCRTFPGRLLFTLQSEPEASRDIWIC